MSMICLLFHDVYKQSPAESGFSGVAAARYKIAARDFDKHLEMLAATLDNPPMTAAQSTPLPRKRLPIALTFDDGGISYHSIIADQLERRGWRGYCFVTTGCIGRRGFLDKRLLRDLHERGHTIGSHSVSHPTRLTACTPKEVDREWRESRETLEDILGTSVTSASVPGGYYAPWIAESADKAGVKTLFTSEPEITKRKIGGCTVIGRFTIR